MRQVNPRWTEHKDWSSGDSGPKRRRGLWGTSTNKNPPEDWDVYPEITSVHQSASDHAAIFVDVNI
jgi:hypothetical protein